MHRAIPIAATCSVALHLTALALMQALYDGGAFPSIASRVLVLTVDALQAEQDVEAERPFDEGERGDPPSALVTEARGAAVDARSGADSVERDVRRAEAVPDEAPAEVAESGAKVPAGGARQSAETQSEFAREPDKTDSARAEFLATRSEREERVATARVEARASPESEPISPAQEQMLSRKLRKWTQSYDQIRKMTGIPWKHQGEEYVATFTELPAADDVGIEHVIVKVSTERSGKRLSTEVRMRRLAFSNYAQFVDRWDPDVEFHDDELDGRFHSNSEIRLNRDGKTAPIFHGKVTTAAHSVDFGDKPGYVRRDQIFAGGLETGVGSIQFPERFAPFPVHAGAHGDRVRYFDEDTRIRFQADGSYAWTAVGSESDEHRAAMSEDASYLIAAKKVELHVEGTVNGKVLVYSPERIIIEGSLVYADDPATRPEADDYLGLVSDKYIEIAPAEVTGPGDLTIDAAIYARRGFTVRGYGVSDGGLLNIYGSLTAGSLSATEPRYRTRIRFDQRLEKLRPPAFPMTDRYEVESWDGAWKVETTRNAP